MNNFTIKSSGKFIKIHESLAMMLETGFSIIGRTYGIDLERIFNDFSNVGDIESATGFLQKTVKQMREGTIDEYAEDRFYDSIRMSCCRDTRYHNKNLPAFLKEKNEELCNSYMTIQSIGQQFLYCYWHNDCMQFVLFKGLIDEIDNFWGVHLVEFLERFSPSEKKQKYPGYDVHGERIRRRLTDASKATSKAIALELFKNQELGKTLEEVRDYYFKIQSTIVDTCNFVLYINQEAERRHQNKQFCLKLLNNEIKQKKTKELMEGTDLQYAKKKLGDDVCTFIYNNAHSMEEIAAKYYHEIPVNLSTPFARVCLDAVEHQTLPKERMIDIAKHREEFTDLRGKPIKSRGKVVALTALAYNLPHVYVLGVFNENWESPIKPATVSKETKHIGAVDMEHFREEVNAKLPPSNYCQSNNLASTIRQSS